MNNEEFEYCEPAKGTLSPDYGTATKDGVTYILVSRTTIADPFGPGRAINGVDEDALESDAGYYPMTLLRLPRKWKRGEEVEEAIPNGEYDWIMREQKGVLTTPRTSTGGRCHDC